MTTDIYNQWFKSIKAELLKSEPINIAIRAESCENVINAATSTLNMLLRLTPKQLQNQLPLRYACHVNTSAHLHFLLHWPGLRISSTSIKAPRTRREYEKKSKNWLNGRRAPNYSKTLFPFFITDAEQYSVRIARHLHPCHKHKQSLYYKALIHKILAGLCGCAVSFNDQAKKAPFFCKNSVERKGKLRDILQSYAPDHQYVQGFPSCSEEAVDYFTRKSNEYVAQYRQIESKQVSCEEVDDDGDSVISEAPPKEEPCAVDVTNNHNKNGHAAYSDMTTFWKAQVMELQRQIAIEKQLRTKAEAERDRLQLVFDVLNNSDLQQNTTHNGGGTYGGMPLLDFPHNHTTSLSLGGVPVPMRMYDATTNNNNNNNNSNNSTGYHDINVNSCALNLQFPKKEAIKIDHNNNNELGQKMAAVLFDMLRTDSSTNL